MAIIKYIDIFAGCGGLSLGLCNAGLQGLFAVEKNNNAFKTLEYNLIAKKEHFKWPEWLPISEHDINELIENYKTQLLKLRGNVPLVVGGPPCQGFSMAGKRDANDKRNSLVNLYIKFIELVQPEMIFFENVHGITVKFKGSHETAYSDYIKEEMKNIGYDVEYNIIDFSEFGIPQGRKRFILVGCKKRKAKDFFNLIYSYRDGFLKEKDLKQHVTVYEAIGDLHKSFGQVPSPDTKNYKAGLYGKNISTYQKLMRKDINESNPVDSHRFTKHTKNIVEIHKRLLKCNIKGKKIKPSDELVLGLKRRGVVVLDPSGISPTVTSSPDEMVHYLEPRILTVREMARLQGFPDSYEFKGKYTTGGKLRKLEVPRYTQVANAIPPLFAEQVGIVIKQMLGDE